jgi:hypothetical protein
MNASLQLRTTLRTTLVRLTGLLVVGATLIGFAPPAHAEEVCVPVNLDPDLRSDNPNYFLYVCVGTDAGSSEEPSVWVYVLNHRQMPLGTGVTVDPDEPGVFGGVWSWTEFDRRAEVVVEVEGTDEVSVCIDTWAPLPEVHECVRPVVL